MRYVTIVALAVSLVGCKVNEQCSQPVACGQRSYMSCTDGTSCRYVTSDGQSFSCNSCGDCTDAVKTVLATCSGGGTGGGNGISETQSCVSYLSCAAALTPSQVATLDATYGPGGTCWTSTTTASACDSACTMALSALRMTPNLPAACNGNGNGNGGSGGSGGGGGNGGSGGSGGFGGGGGSGGGSGGPDMMGKLYQHATVKQMRQGASGDFVLTGVVSIGLTPSMSAPRLFFQDAGGGDFSAMVGKCSLGSPSRPCPQSTLTTILSIADGHTLSINGTYVKATNGFEQFYIDTVTDNGVGTMPAATVAQLGDIARNANTAKWWFQRVTVDLGAGLLKMYDFSPIEMKYSSPTGAVCPAYFGWGMVPSTSSDVVGGACNATTQPPTAVTGTAPSDEVIIGTDFYRSFTYSADCACAGGAQATLATGASTFTGVIGGILIGDSVYQGTTLYQYLAPKSTSDAPLH
jgi:hypothetical protein